MCVCVCVCVCVLRLGEGGRCWVNGRRHRLIRRPQHQSGGVVSRNQGGRSACIDGKAINQSSKQASKQASKRASKRPINQGNQSINQSREYKQARRTHPGYPP